MFNDYVWIDSYIYNPKKEIKEEVSVFICNANDFFDKNNKDDFYYFCSTLDQSIKESKFREIYRELDDLLVCELEVYKYIDIGYDIRDIYRMANTCTFMLFFDKIDVEKKNIVSEINNYFKEFLTLIV